MPGIHIVVAAAPSVDRAVVVRIDPAVAAHLGAWQKVTSAVTSLSRPDLRLTRRNSVLMNEQVYTGSLICLKPNRVRLRLDRLPTAGQNPDPNDYATYIWSGRAIYEYDGSARVVTEYRLRSAADLECQLLGEFTVRLRTTRLLYDLVSGEVSPAALVRRFDVALVKQDPLYLYLELRPRSRADRAEFEAITLALFHPGVKDLAYLPRTVVIRRPSGDEEAWDFPKPTVNAAGVTPAMFEYAPPPPKDWAVNRPPAG